MSDKTDYPLVYSDKPPNRAIYLEDRSVNVNVLKISMSKRHGFVLLCDLFTISLTSYMTCYLTTITSSILQTIICCSIASFVWLLSVAKMIVDFLNWMYTMNSMQSKMGVLYLKDVCDLCNDLISAACKVTLESSKGVASEFGQQSCNEEKSVDT